MPFFEVIDGFVLDDHVRDHFLHNSTVIAISPAGKSDWVETRRIDIRLPDGSQRSYFKKVKNGEAGKKLMLGCFESEKDIYSYLPFNVPKPIAFNSYKSDPDTYFFLDEFHSMTDDPPDPRELAALIAKLHNDSRGKSPNKKYGFRVPTHLGNIALDNTWTDTWEEFFAANMKHLFKIEEEIHGNDPELTVLATQLLEKVIPRLLRPLEESIEPCLIHSDLWSGNVKPDSETGKLILFDSCAFWGHHEADLSCMRAPRYGMGQAYVDEYHRLVPKSEPVEDWDDRNALYAMLKDLVTSAMWPKEKKFRFTAMKEMTHLVGKYPNGFMGMEI